MFVREGDFFVQDLARAGSVFAMGRMWGEARIFVRMAAGLIFEPAQKKEKLIAAVGERALSAVCTAWLREAERAARPARFD